TLHPAPYSLHPIPYTLHPTPYTLHPIPYTLHPTPYTLHPKTKPLTLQGTVSWSEHSRSEKARFRPSSASPTSQPCRLRPAQKLTGLYHNPSMSTLEQSAIQAIIRLADESAVQV
ncbi:hypothetical protein T484DRAFT_1619997, partial [Baffinella frigidus]